MPLEPRGFTLIELIIIMILIGIISAIALPHFADRTTFDARGFADQAQSMLRYAQKLAVAQNRDVYVRFNGTDIALCFDNACGAKVPPPAAKSSAGGSCTTTWFCETLPTDVTYTVSPASYESANAAFYFSALGQPFNTGDVPPTTNFNTQLQVTVAGGGVSSDFKIERETGYVHE